MTVPATSSSLRLPPDGHAPAAARRHVRSALEEARADELVDDALLLVTELVTNAVVHAGTEVELVVTVDEGGLRAEVRDQSPGDPPQVRGHADDAREGGRGLFLLDALATEWGTTHTRSGKAIWFRLGAPSGRPPVAPVPVPTAVAAQHEPDFAWLLALPEDLEARMSPSQVLRELLHRLGDLLGAEDALLLVEEDGDTGRWTPAACRGREPSAADVAAIREVVRGSRSPVTHGDGRTAVMLRGRGGAFGAVVLGVDRLDPLATVATRLAADRMAMVVRDERVEMTQRRERGSLSLLAEASDLFAGTLDVQLAVTLAAQLVVPRLAQWAAVYVTGDQGPRLGAVTHEDEERTTALREAFSAAAGEAFAQRLARDLSVQRPVLVGRAELGSVLGEHQAGDVLALPLVARRRLLGGLLVARPEGVAYSAEDVTLLLDLARRAGLAVDNARLYQDRTEIASALQASLLPPELPRADEVDFGARYLPAGEGNEVGGDFYDVFALPAGGWAVAIGDVCGKGAEAAAITGLARNVLRLLLRDGRSPAEALRRLNDAILELGDRGRFCTAAVATLTGAPDGLRVVLASAGHPLPVVVGRAGTTRLVGRTGTLLGVVPSPDLHDEPLLLEPSESLVLYTDGVTERRRGSQMFGEETLLGVLRQSTGRSADSVAGLLEQEVRGFGPEASRDDLAVLVVRATGGLPAVGAVAAARRPA